jgi:hypothetical protein
MTVCELSIAERFAKIDDNKRKEFLSSLTDIEAREIIYTWDFWARPNQKPPAPPWHTWMLLAGRGFGKTRVGSETVIQWAREGCSPIALIGKTKADVRDIMVEVGDSSILKVSPPDFYPKYESTNRRLTWPNGSVAIIFSGDEYDQLRGLQLQKGWIDELAKYQYAEQTYEQANIAVRSGLNPQILITTTPRPMKLLKDILADKYTVVTRGRTLENKSNLSPSYLEFIIGKYQGTRLGRQELEGELLDKMEGLVYDSFRYDTQVIPKRDLPKDWPRYVGHDFGMNNTAAVWFAQDPHSGDLFLYRTYHQDGGTLEHVNNFKELSEGEFILKRVGGNHNSEQAIRDAFTQSGWPVVEPKFSRSVETQVERTWTTFQQNKIYIFNDLLEFLDELTTFSYEIDENDKKTEKFHNEPAYHLLASLRYVISDFAIDTGAKPARLHVTRRF